MTTRQLLSPALALCLAAAAGVMVARGSGTLILTLLLLSLGVAFTARYPDRAVALYLVATSLVGTSTVLSAGGFPDFTVERILIAWALFVMLNAARESAHLRSRELGRTRGLLEMQSTSIVLFLGFTLFAGLRTSQPMSDIQPWLDQYLLPLTAMVIAARVAWTKTQFRTIALAACLSGAIWGISAVAEVITRRSFFTSDGSLPWTTPGSVPRSGAAFVAPSALGTALGVVAILVLGTLLFHRILPRWVSLGTLVVSTAGIAVTVTRASWIAYVAGMLVVIGFGRVNRARMAFLVATCGAAAFFALSAATGSGALSERLLSPGEVFNRIVPGVTAVRLIADHPLTGLGYGGYEENFSGALTSVGSISSVYGADPTTPHNTVLRVGVESGLVGALALLGLWLFTALLYREYAKDTRTRWLAAIGSAALVVYFVNALAIDMVVTRYLNGFFYTILGVLIGHGIRVKANMQTTDSAAS